MNRRSFLKGLCAAPVVGLGVLAAEPESIMISGVRGLNVDPTRKWRKFDMEPKASLKPAPGGRDPRKLLEELSSDYTFDRQPSSKTSMWVVEFGDGRTKVWLPDQSAGERWSS